MKNLTIKDIEAIEIGAGILGCGGGGNPYYSKIQLLEKIKNGSIVRVMSLDDLDDDAWVVAVGTIGSPMISIEKIPQGDEIYRAVKVLKKETGRKVDALIAIEIGGANSFKPMITASQLGLPIIDGDCTGRAFPETQMTTLSIYGQNSAPAAMSDDHGNTVVFTQLTKKILLERLARAFVEKMGGTAGIAIVPMTGSFFKRFAIPDTISQAIALGYTVMEANQKGRDPISEICQIKRGRQLFTGRITDIERVIEAGFTRGKVTIEGINDFNNEKATIDVQNENLILRCNGEISCSVPDLIVVLNIETGHAITTEILRYGQRISVLGLACHPLLKTEAALRVVGPKAFGYPEVTYQPLAE